MGSALTRGSPSSFCTLGGISPKDITQSSLLNQSPPKKCSPTNIANGFRFYQKAQSTPSPKVCRDTSNLQKPALRRHRKSSSISGNGFSLLELLQTETLGRAYLMRKEDNGDLYVVKSLNKARIRSCGLQENVQYEKDILERAKHPSIPSLSSTLETEKKILWVINYVQRYKLEELLEGLSRFSEEITRFYAAEILTALDYLHHEMGYSYNNMKTQNIRLDEEGHVILIDFANVQHLKKNNVRNEACSEGKMVDFWQLGCLVYELVTGNRLPERETSQLQGIPEEKLKWPSSVSSTTRDFIIRLISPKEKKRLGYNGIKELKEHAFFSGIKWKNIEQRRVFPPLNPNHVKENSKEDEEEDQEQELEDDYCSSKRPFNIHSSFGEAKRIGKPPGCAFQNVNYLDV